MIILSCVAVRRPCAALDLFLFSDRKTCRTHLQYMGGVVHHTYTIWYPILPIPFYFFFRIGKKSQKKKKQTLNSISCSILFYLFASVLCFYGNCSVILWLFCVFMAIVLCFYGICFIKTLHVCCFCSVDHPNVF